MTGVARGDWYRAGRTPVNFSGSQLANNKAISGKDAGAYLYRIPEQTLLLLSVNISKLNTPIRDYSHLRIDISIPIISIVLRLYFSTEIKNQMVESGASNFYVCPIFAKTNKNISLVSFTHCARNLSKKLDPIEFESIFWSILKVEWIN